VNQLLPVGKLKLASGSCVPEAKGNAGMQAIRRINNDDNIVEYIR
jgi:hypothetical protein